MDVISDIVPFREAVTDFLTHYGQFVPEEAPDGLTGNPRALLMQAASQISPVDQARDVAEVLYAFSGAIEDATARAAAQTLAVHAALLPAQQNWGVLRADQRGTKISWAMRRDLGEEAPEGRAWPATKDDPAVDERYKPTATAFKPPSP